MTERETLIAAICYHDADRDNRKEDTPRLAYADWLEENGESERGEFIRVQIGIVCCAECGGSNSLAVEGITARMACWACKELRRRERELWMNSPQHKQEWAGAAAVLYRKLSLHGWSEICHFTRGFVSQVKCSWLDWLAHADAILREQPVQRVKLTTRPELAGHDGDQGWADWIVTPQLKHRWPRIAFELPAEPRERPAHIRPVYGAV